VYKGNADGMAGQRHLVMKHRRIVSDTSALYLPMSLMPQQQQQHGAVMPPLTTNNLDAPLKQYVYNGTKNRPQFTVGQLEEASTHKSTKINANDVYVTCDLDLLIPN